MRLLRVVASVCFTALLQGSSTPHVGPAVDPAGFLEQPLFFALWETFNARASNSECATLHSTIQQTQQDLEKNAVYQAAMNSPAKLASTAALRNYLDQCLQGNGFGDESEQCKSLRDARLAAWRAEEESCEFAALRALPENKALEEANEKQWKMGCSGDAAQEAWFTVRRSEVTEGTRSDDALPIYRLESVLKETAQTRAWEAFHAEGDYAQLATMLAKFADECLQSFASLETDSCKARFAQAKDVAGRLKETQAWKDVVGSRAYAGAMAMLRDWPNRCE